MLFCEYTIVTDERHYQVRNTMDYGNKMVCKLKFVVQKFGVSRIFKEVSSAHQG